MVKDYITIGELAEIMYIDEVSARELLDEIIGLDVDELLTLALFASVGMDQLVVEQI